MSFARMAVLRSSRSFVRTADGAGVASVEEYRQRMHWVMRNCLNADRGMRRALRPAIGAAIVLQGLIVCYFLMIFETAQKLYGKVLILCEY